MAMAVSFDLVKKDTLEFKVLGVLNMETYAFTDPPKPFVKDEIVRLISGKFLLQDYTDTSSHSQHVYVFQREDGTNVSGILDGFTHDCTYAGQNKNLGIPRVYVLIKEEISRTA